MPDTEKKEAKTLDAIAAELTASEEKLTGLVKDLQSKNREDKDEISTEMKAADERLNQAVADAQGEVTELREKYGELATNLKGAEERAEKAEDRLKEVERLSQQPGGGGFSPPDEQKTIGEMFIESQQVKDAVAAKRPTTAPFDVPGGMGFWSPQAPAELGEKASFLSTAATRLVVPFRRDLVRGVERVLRIRDLLPVRPTSSDAIEYVEEIGFAQQGAASGTETSGAAAPTAEGADYPEAQIELNLITKSVRDIGHHINASRRILSDLPTLRSYIDDRLMFGVQFKEETELLRGDDSSPNLAGFLTHAGRSTYSWSAGETSPVADTKIDAFRRGLRVAHVAEHRPTGGVLNPVDWEEMELAKDTQGRYLMLVVSTGADERLFRIPVVVTNAMTSGEGLIGAFQTGCTLWDREQTSVRVSEHHDKNFTSRMVTILAEERVCLTIYYPEAFVDLDFDAAPS